MKQKAYFMHRNRILGFFIGNIKGNALPLVLMLVLVVMLVGGSVAYSTMQMYNITRDGYHDQLTYIAAENVLEKSIANLQKVITVSGYPGSQGVFFSNNVDDFLNSLIEAINTDAAIQNSYSVKVHDTLNAADVSVKFQRYGQDYTYTGSMLTFSVQIEATAEMVDESYSSYGKKAVAVREFTIPIYTRFTLNGAVYTLGDLLITSGKPIASDYSTIRGDVFVFGTGLDKTNRMQQYYTGGVCSTHDSILHVENGSIITRNLVRAGTFDDSDPDPVTGGNSSSIIVDEDVVAQGIQVFGTNDNIVVIGDAYTFDDVEMNGADSIIAINGNYFGLNPGDGRFHDNSSAIQNVSPMYVNTQEYQESRIAINGNIFANGVTFRLNGDEAGHKMESVSMTWRDTVSGYKPLHTAGSIDWDDQAGYDDLLMTLPGVKDGFSVLWKVNWNYDNAQVLNPEHWTLWKNWVQEINDATNFRNNNGIALPAATDLQGFCHYGIAANNIFYKFNPSDEGFSEVKRPASPVTFNVVDKIPGQESTFHKTLDYTGTTWSAYVNSWGTAGSISNEMDKLMGHLKALVHVFAQKEINNSDGTFNYNYQVATSTQTEFNRLKDILGNETDFPNEPFDRCIVRYADDGFDEVPVTSYLNDELELLDMNNDDFPPVSDPPIEPDPDPTDDYQSYYFLVVNLDPDRELRITDTFNGIIFSLGRVVIEQDGEVIGAIIAAGKGFDDDTSGSGVAGSSADVYDEKTRLPRVIADDTAFGSKTIDNFTHWKYAAIEIKNGGNIYYPGNVELLNYLKNNPDVDLTNRSIDLFNILNVEVTP